MEIKARVVLNLPNTFYKVILKYDTYEKATYDSYLIAALISNTKSHDEAFEYIDEITGKGSLNSHFKKLYEEISKLTNDQINGILENSLYPVTVVNEKNNFKYYPMLNATRIQKKVYVGNLSLQTELVKDLIMPQGNKIKFLSLEYSEEPGKVEMDTYDAIFTNDCIKIDLANNQYFEISKEDFNKVYKNDVESLNGYLGKVGTEITIGKWNVLSKSIVELLNQTNLKYKDSRGMHTVLSNECIKTIEIINAFNLYFYKENKYEFSKANSLICEDAINYLLESKNINEFKTKALINILKCVSDETSQKVIQYILNRKDSKEISELGLSLIKYGLEKGWEENILKSIKRFTLASDYKYLYRINPNLGFEIEEIINIDNTELTPEDKERKEKYMSDNENYLKSINQIIGDMTNSGVREKIKSLEYSKLKNEVKKFLDKRTGHNKKDYTKMTLGQLQKEYNEILVMYNGTYQEIIKLLKERNLL